MKNEIRTTKNEMNLADNMTINYKTREIIITKRMKSAASKFGSEAYNTLKAARTDNPDFTVIVRTTAKSKTRLKLNYDFMTAYIQKHDDDNKTVMAAFKAEQQKMKKPEEGELKEPYSFCDLRKWFLKQFPEVKDFINNTKKAA